MNDYLFAVLFGIIEGITEFLPISSTAHLRLVKPVCGISLDDPYWKMFDVVIQLGAVMCLPVYFRKRIHEFVRTFPRGADGRGTALNHPATLVLLAFVVTAIPALLLSRVISENLESLTIFGASLFVGGVVMWIVDARCRNPRTMDVTQVTWAQAAWVGAVQVLAAVFPGTSRSMTTIAAGQTAGLSRAAALEFSFFVSIPTMFAATSYDLLKTTLGAGAGLGDGTNLVPLTMTGHQWITLAIGFVVSFFVAWAVVAWFMAWVRRHGFIPFAIYRILLGAGILGWLYLG